MQTLRNKPREPPSRNPPSQRIGQDLSIILGVYRLLINSRIHRHTQRASFKCTNCDKIFCRSDVLRRHINEKHAGRREEFLCPNMGCKKSQKGHGFKRRDKLEKHKIDSCKGRVRVTSSNQSTASTSPMTVSTPDDATDAPCIRQESSPAARIDNEAGSDVGTLQNQDVILKLQRRYRAEHEALLMKEEECQEMRKRLASLHAVIELVQGSSTATSI